MWCDFPAAPWKIASPAGREVRKCGRLTGCEPKTNPRDLREPSTNCSSGSRARLPQCNHPTTTPRLKDHHEQDISKGHVRPKPPPTNTSRSVAAYAALSNSQHKDGRLQGIHRLHRKHANDTATARTGITPRLQMRQDLGKVRQGVGPTPRHHGASMSSRSAHPAPPQ